MELVKLILPSVWSGVYYNTARLLKYSLEDNGITCLITEVEESDDADLSILLGWNLIPNSVTFNNPYIIYQLEPLCHEHWREKLNSKLSLFRNAYSIWDYASYNQKYLSECGLNSIIVPLGYHQKMDEITHNKFTDYDVLFVGFITQRRQKILEDLNKHCCVSIQPRWGNDFSEGLSRSKILLNIHQYEIPTPLEQPRIAYALNNSCFVLSEESIDNPYKNLITCSLDSLVKEALHYLHHTKLRNEINSRLFDSFKSIQMKDLVAKCIKM